MDQPNNSQDKTALPIMAPNQPNQPRLFPVLVWWFQIGVALLLGFVAPFCFENFSKSVQVVGDDETAFMSVHQHAWAEQLPLATIMSIMLLSAFWAIFSRGGRIKNLVLWLVCPNSVFVVTFLLTAKFVPITDWNSRNHVDFDVQGLVFPFYVLGLLQTLTAVLLIKLIAGLKRNHFSTKKIAISDYILMIVLLSIELGILSQLGESETDLTPDFPDASLADSIANRGEHSARTRTASEAFVFRLDGMTRFQVYMLLMLLPMLWSLTPKHFVNSLAKSGFISGILFLVALIIGLTGFTYCMTPLYGLVIYDWVPWSLLAITIAIAYLSNAFPFFDSHSETL